MLLGWDTDQFPTDLYGTTMAMMSILKQNGLGSGGLNFDAKVRRASIDPVDLFYAHIGGMDAFARGLLTARKILDDGSLTSFLEERYASYGSGIGLHIMTRKAGFEEVEQWILRNGNPVPRSGRQELLENMINSYIQ